MFYGLSTTEALEPVGITPISFISTTPATRSAATRCWPTTRMSSSLPGEVAGLHHSIAQRELGTLWNVSDRIWSRQSHSVTTGLPPARTRQLAGVPGRQSSPFDAGIRNSRQRTQQLTYQLYAPALARYDKVIVFSRLQAEVLERPVSPLNVSDHPEWC